MDSSLNLQFPTWDPAIPCPPCVDLYASWEDILALPPKARGELAEARLVTKLMEMGITVAKPLGDSAKWDLIIQAGRKISRLQVKSAWVKSGTGYQISAGPSYNHKHGCRRCYGLDEIDFLVAYIAPEDTWFVFPVRVVRDNNVFVKTDPGWRLARYRERWELLYRRN